MTVQIRCIVEGKGEVDLVGAVSNCADLECLINSKIYYSVAPFTPSGASHLHLKRYDKPMKDQRFYLRNIFTAMVAIQEFIEGCA